MTPKLRVLIVGAGSMARRHLDAYRQIDGVQVVGAVARTKNSAKRFFEETGIPTVAGLDNALSRFRFDAADICTPTETHRNIAQPFIERGVHVLVEKPLALTVEDAAYLASEALTRHSVCAVAHTEVFTPALVALANFFADAKPYAIAISKLGESGLPNNAPAPENWTEQDRRNRLFDLLVHLVSAALPFINSKSLLASVGEKTFEASILALADGRTVLTEVRRFDDTPGKEQLLASIELPNGVQLRLSLDANRCDTLTKYVEVRSNTTVAKWQYDFKHEHTVVYTFERQRKTWRAQRLMPEGSSPFVAQVEDFVKAILTKSSPRQDFTAGAIAVAIANGILSRAYFTRKRTEHTLKVIINGSWHQIDELLRFNKNSFLHRNVLRLALKKLDGAKFAYSSNKTVNRFGNIVKRLRSVVRLKPYHLRFVWEHLNSSDNAFDDNTAFLALVYSGAMGKELVLRLDTRCNQACLFCNVGSEAHKNLFLSTAQAKSLIAAAVSDDVVRLTLTGGEPTLRPDLPELIDFAHRAGFDDILLQTNAVALSDGWLACVLADAGLDLALVSLHSHIEKISDFLTAAPGTWRKTINGIKHLIKAGVRVRLAHVITTANYKFIAQFLKFVAEEFGREVREIDLLLNQHTGRGSKRDYLVPRLSEIEPYLRSAFDVANKLGIEINNALTIPPCFMAGRVEQTLEFQRMVAAEKFGIDWGEDLQILMREKRKGKQCKQCALDKYCLGVWRGYAELFGTDELKPIRTPPKG